MNCDECRDEIVRGERGSGVEAHVASCSECGAWREQEMVIMGQLQQLGTAWRERGMRAEVAARIPAARGSGLAGRIARFAAAAAVLVVAAGGVYVATRPTPASAMAVMVRELRERGNVRFVMSAPFLPGESGVMSISGERMRIELANGDVVISDPGSGKTVMLKPSTREIASVPAAGGAFDFYGMLLGLADAPRTEELGVDVVDGRAAEKYRVMVREAGAAFAGSEVVVWLDAATRLPLRMEAPVKDPRGNDGTVTLSGFGFDEAMEAGLFDTDPPGYAAVSPTAATPAIGNMMRLKIRNVGMAFHVYMQEHDGAVPETIEALAAYLEPGGLKSLRKPEEEVGYVYVKPRLPLNYEHIVLYERFAEGSESVLVVLVNSTTHVKTWAEVEAMVREARGE